MKLIDADKLKNHYSWWKGGTREMSMDEAKSDFDTIIDLQPEVKPKHGTWIIRPVRDWGCTNAKCSECGEETFLPKILVSNEYPYCPKCGSRNEVEE